MADGFCRTCRVYFASIVLLCLKPPIVAELIALSVFVPTLRFGGERRNRTSKDTRPAGLQSAALPLTLYLSVKLSLGSVVPTLVLYLLI